MALRACMADAAEALFPPLRSQLESQLDRREHDDLSAIDIAKWAAPEGMLAAEVGVQNGFKAELAEDKNVRKVPGRHVLNAVSPVVAAAAAMFCVTKACEKGYTAKGTDNTSQK